MKKSELRKIIREETIKVLKEEETAEPAPEAPPGDRTLQVLDKIKQLTKILSKQQTIRTNPGAQKLNAKFTGLLGKMTSYINQELTPEPEAAPAPETPDQTGEENI